MLFVGIIEEFIVMKLLPEVNTEAVSVIDVCDDVEIKDDICTILFSDAIIIDNVSTMIISDANVDDALVTNT